MRAEGRRNLKSAYKAASAPAGVLRELVAEGRVMRATLMRAARFAGTPYSIVLTGESGTGKELVARQIHAWSGRRNRPFVTVNCGAIPSTLFEATLFGTRRSAFTVAVDSKGRLEEAHGGTLFLDEVGELKPEDQPKLLRFLQEGEVQRLGSGHKSCVDVRVLAATHRTLTPCGVLREDLYYRLAQLTLELPALRDRGADWETIAKRFLLGEAAIVGRKRIAPCAHALLRRYGWPGNVRELFNVLRQAALETDDTDVLATHLPARLRLAADSVDATVDPEEMVNTLLKQQGSFRSIDLADGLQIRPGAALELLAVGPKVSSSGEASPDRRITCAEKRHPDSVRVESWLRVVLVTHRGPARIRHIRTGAQPLRTRQWAI